MCVYITPSRKRRFNCNEAMILSGGGLQLMAASAKLAEGRRMSAISWWAVSSAIGRRLVDGERRPASSQRRPVASSGLWVPKPSLVVLQHRLGDPKPGRGDLEPKLEVSKRRRGVPKPRLMEPKPTLGGPKPGLGAPSHQSSRGGKGGLYALIYKPTSEKMPCIHICI